MDADQWLQMEFPNLRHEYFEIKSSPADEYNCIAWAAHDTTHWWQPSGDPDHYWPPGLPSVYILENYTHAFEILGYEVCDSEIFELGYEKVAIYSDSQGIPQHMARQLASGLWTSKLGRGWDIEHQTLHAVEGHRYGTVVRYMKRAV